ncbi:hypothetical protein B566_EDAN004287 [Ephemera danica]|nr:hypothetical protein B566_EDAN004287 [Ephemera danica]
MENKDVTQENDTSKRVLSCQLLTVSAAVFRSEQAESTTRLAKMATKPKHSTDEQKSPRSPSKHKQRSGRSEHSSGVRPARDRKQRKHYTDDWAFGDEEIDGLNASFDLEDRLTSPRFEQCSVVKEMVGSELTVAYLQRHGFSTPILFKEKTGLGLCVPSDRFTVNDVRMCVGSRRMLDVMDVRTQKNMEMSMKEWQRYYETPNKESLLNVISLEFSHTKLENYVQTPTIVRQIDWVDCVWPRHLKEAQTEATNLLEDMMYPKVQKYCLMSVKGCYTDFHVDFGGTSVWYHILKGAKIFWLIQPTENNLKLYEQWVLSGKQSDIFFGDMVDKCGRVTLAEGNTFFIPSGWIHAVYTPKDSLVFGGNFLHSFGIEKQLRTAQVEDTTRKFRYPFFTEMLWYVLERYVHCLLGNSHLRLPPEEEALRHQLRPHEQVHLTMYELHGLKKIVMFLHELPPHKKNVPELITNPIKLITDVRDLVHAHCQDNPVLAITGRPAQDRRQPLGRSMAGQRGGGRGGHIMGRGGGRGRGKSSGISPGAPTHAGNSAANNNNNNNQGPRRRRTRCKKCEACLRSDCGECSFCLDMVKFGGPGRAKQTCVMRQCLQPMLPVTAACASCKLDGWGREPVVPIQKSAERAGVPSSLMECSVCYEIIHPACVRLADGTPSTEGQVNEDMPNSWECPKCCHDGKNMEYKPRHFRARNKTQGSGGGGSLGGTTGGRRDSVSSESSITEQKPDLQQLNIKREHELEEHHPIMSPLQVQVKTEPEPPQLSPVKLEPPHLSPEGADPPPPLLEGEVARPVAPPVTNTSPPARPPLRSQLAAQLCGASSKQLKRPFVVRSVLTPIFRRLNQRELCLCMLVCKAWSSAACNPALWKNVSLAHCKVAAAHLQGVVRRQPASLTLDWSSASAKQLGWLLPRLPQLQALSLQGCAYGACVSALRTCTCPALASLDLSFVTGLNDSSLREILSPPLDSRPGLADSRSRLRNLRELRLAGCDISDVSLRYIVQFLRSLELLSVSSCYKVTDAGVAQLCMNTAPTVTTLQSLDLSGCKLITDLSLEHLSRIKTLSWLDCRHIPQISTPAVARFCQQRPSLDLTKLISSVNCKGCKKYKTYSILIHLSEKAV